MAKKRGRKKSAPQRRRAAPQRKKTAARQPRRRRTPSAAKKVVATRGGLTISEVTKLDELRRALERAGRSASPLRWNADPDDVQRSVAHLVLTLVEFIRKLLERQAIRRMEAGTLTSHQTEDVGRALMKLEETVLDIATKFGIAPEELNLDLGPVGKLM
jgi:hypothetical protein